MTVTNTGEVEITFSEDFLLVDPLDIDSALTLELMPFTDSRPEMQGFYWRTTSFTESSLTLKIFF